MLWVAVYNTLFGSFLAGISMDLNAPQALFQQFINETVAERYGIHLNRSQLDLIWSIVLAMSSIGSIVGSSSFWILENFGYRNGVIRLGCIFAIFGNALHAVAKSARSIEIFAAGSVLTGLQNGLIIGFLPQFIGEIVSPDRSCKGALLTCVHIFLWLSAMTLQFASARFALGTPERWDWIFWIILGLNCIYFLSSWCFPEAPSYYRNIRPDALNESRSRQYYYGQNLALNQSGANSYPAIKEQLTLRKKWAVLSSHPRTLLMCVLVAISAPISGFFQLATFTTQLTEDKISWFDTETAQMFTLLFFVVLILSLVFPLLPLLRLFTTITNCNNLRRSVIAIPLVEKLGRRPLLVWGSFTLVLANLILFGSSKVLEMDRANVPAAICLFLGNFLVVIGFNMGCGPISLFMHGELVDPSVSHVVLGYGWTLNVLITMLLVTAFYPLLNWIGSWQLFGWAIINFLLFLAFYFWLEETKPVAKSKTTADEKDKLAVSDSRSARNYGATKES